MIGFVDEELRALLQVQVSAEKGGEKTPLDVWVDTAFNGGLVIPRDRIAVLGLSKSSSTEAILADGQLVELETFACYLDWFGTEYRTQVIANDGQFPLLGTMLLAKRRLLVDYSKRALSLE
ncbi:MAG: hypothetical protein R3E01_10875 [Pirellulaceae bacterium]